MTASFKYIFSLFSLFSLLNCASLPADRLPKLELLSVYEIPFETQYMSTLVGGLSGIDYDKKEDKYYVISDDRAEHNDARIYEATINIHQDKIQDVTFNNVIYLKDKQQKSFLSSKKNPLHSTDPEDLRFNAKKNTLVWSSEGERWVREGAAVLVNPSVTETDLKGFYLNGYEMPSVLKMSATEQGPRRNGGLEGLAFNKNYTKLYASLEEPLYEDGAQANLKEGGITRFFEFDALSFKNTKQYYYPLDAVAKAPSPEDAFSVNGVSAILYDQKNNFFVVERSYSVGTEACTIKIYQYNLNGAQQVLDRKSIHKTKTLLLNLDTLGIFTDNIEGITFGPKLKTGERSLLLISDNNFSKDQKTQIFLFKIKK